MIRSRWIWILFFKDMFLGHGFGSAGALIGRRPALFFTIATVVAVASGILLVIKPVSIRVSFDDGYTTPDAPSIRELNTQIDFFGNRGKPWYMALFAQPKYPNGSMTNTQEFTEFRNFYQYSKHNLTIREEGDQSFNYMDYCSVMCGFNDVLYTTWDLAFFGLQWPTTSLFGYKSNIGKYFFQRGMGKGDQLASANLTALYFMVFLNSTQMEQDIREYERIVSIEVERYNANPANKILITQHSARGVEMEITRGTMMLKNYIIAGLVLVSFCTLLSLVLMNRAHGRCGARVLVLFLVVVFVPLLSVISAAAVFSIFFRHLNTLTFFTPVVTFALGLDGMFILYNMWLYESNRRNDDISEIFREVFASTFPSLSISFAPALVLLFGVFFPIEEFANLSLFVGISLVFTFFYLVFFFAPSIIWFAPVPTHRVLPTKKNSKCSRTSGFWQENIVEPSGTLMARSNLVKIGSVVLFSGLILLPSIFGIDRVEANLDYRNLLPPGSPNAKGIHLMSDVVWPEFLHIVFFIESPPDLQDTDQYSQFKSFMADINALPGAMGENANMMWIYDYMRFTHTTKMAPALNMSQFRNFITDDIYKAWNSGVKYIFPDENSDVPLINRMVSMVAFEGTKTMADKARLMKRCRQMANKYAQFSIVPFDTEVGMADVITQIPSVLLVFPLVIYLLVFIFFLCFSSNFTVSLVALLGSASIYTATVLICSLCGVTLNPFSVAFLLFAAVISTKYIGHIVYFFQLAIHTNGKADDVTRLQDTFSRALLPSLLSSFSGACSFFPVLLCGIVIFNFLSIINLILFLAGLLHLLFFTPTVLAWLPAKLVGTNFFVSDN